MFRCVLHCVSYFHSATSYYNFSTLIGWRLSVIINDMLCYVMLCYLMLFDHTILYCPLSFSVFFVAVSSENALRYLTFDIIRPTVAELVCENESVKGKS